MKTIPWATVAIVAGFLVGFGIGASTRKQASNSIKTSVYDGKINVEVDTYKMIGDGVGAFLDEFTG